MSGEGMPLATVLVADDSEDNRELLSQMLRVQGYRVVCAADGAEALDVLAGQPIDLALVDVMMPRCTGFAVCRTVKARPETRLIPVVLITGLGNQPRFRTRLDRKSTRLNSSHVRISYAVFCLQKKNTCC